LHLWKRWSGLGWKLPRGPVGIPSVPNGSWDGTGLKMELELALPMSLSLSPTHLPFQRRMPGQTGRRHDDDPDQILVLSRDGTQMPALRNPVIRSAVAAGCVAKPMGLSSAGCSTWPLGTRTGETDRWKSQPAQVTVDAAPSSSRARVGQQSLGLQCQIVTSSKPSPL